MSFTEKLISVVFTLGKAASGAQRTFSNGRNTLTLSGYRVSATIAFAGSGSQPQASVNIYGMNISDMNSLASYGDIYFASQSNTVTILAGDAAGLSKVFVGDIQDAFVDFSQAPNVCFSLSAFTGQNFYMAPTDPISFKGPVSVSTIMAVLASRCLQVNGMPLTLENSGVTAILSNPYFSGSPAAMIEACARAARINWHINGEILSIWPQDGYRLKVPGITLTPTTGLVGYPSYTYQGVIYRSQFIPGQAFGSLVTISGSEQVAANAKWAVFSMTHTLESKVFGGDWCSDVMAYKPNFIATVSAQ